MTESALDALAGYRERIDIATAQVFADLPKLLDFDISAHSVQALKHLEDYTTRPGKRIRGSLGALAYDTAASGTYEPVGIQLGVVLELLQNYLLIVDDVMDKSTLRRGQPTLHILYAAETADFGGTHEADMLAVNVGVLAQHLANLLLASLPVAPKRIVQAVTILHTNISATGFGQLDDLYQQPGRDFTEDDLLRKYALKSSHYTFVNPLQLGFVLGGKSDSATLELCQAFGEPAGIAFQLRDDYLGIFGETSAIGKANLDDIREGKYTLLVHTSLERADKAERAKLLAILGDSKAGTKELRTVQEIMKHTGAVEYCQHQAQHYAAAAKAALDDKPLGTPEFSAILRDVVDYSINRGK